MKILFIVPYCSMGASNRYRVEQYLPYLKAEGYEYDVSPFVTSEYYEIIYKKGLLLKKICCLFNGLGRRIKDLTMLSSYDIIFIHREVCPFGPAFFEWIIHKINPNIIFDFDDAIFINNCNPANKFYSFLKFPFKTKNIIKISSRVIVANKFLKEYASNFNKKVSIIATSIDTKRFNIEDRKRDAFVIGWVGSETTASYLKLVYSALQRLSEKYAFVLKIVGAGRDISIPGVNIENRAWNIAKEVDYFKDTDIGIYPMPDNSWTRGKAAFKAIQYMAVGVPVVASPVGMTNDVIEDSFNGFLAYSEDDWVKKLSMLIEDCELRKIIGLKGRETIEENYSINTNVPKFLKIIESIRK